MALRVVPDIPVPPCDWLTVTAEEREAFLKDVPPEPAPTSRRKWCERLKLWYRRLRDRHRSP